MTSTSAQLLDFFDDPTGEVLQRVIPDYNQLPDFVKEARVLSEDIHQSLPDDVFALVMFNGSEKLRKYACVDAGNTALSVMYFLENHDKLPVEAVKTAAANLVTACSWYDMSPPPPLEKLAIVSKVMNVGLGAMTVTDTASRAKTWSQNPTATPEQFKAMRSKVGELNGTEIMPNSPPLKKKASFDPYVDVTGSFVWPSLEREEYDDAYYCLVKEGSRRFPIHSYSEVEQAVRYFGEIGHNLHPRDRHEYCVKLAARASELGIELDSDLQKLGSVGYAPDLGLAVATRMQVWAEDGPERDMLKALMAKQGSIAPEVFAEALAELDKTAGVAHLWDQHIPDPWYSTFGFTKIAEWSFVSGNDRVTESDLKLFAKSPSGRGTMAGVFDEDLVKEFQENPVTIFESLPLDSKRIIMRMASDRYTGGPGATGS